VSAYPETTAPWLSDNATRAWSRAFDTPEPHLEVEVPWEETDDDDWSVLAPCRPTLRGAAAGEWEPGPPGGYDPFPVTVTRIASALEASYRRPPGVSP